MTYTLFPYQSPEFTGNKKTIFVIKFSPDRGKLINITTPLLLLPARPSRSDGRKEVIKVLGDFCPGKGRFSLSGDGLPL